MPATPEEMRLTKEKFADILIGFQQGRIDLPDALAAVRDFEIPIEIPGPVADSPDANEPDPASTEPGDPAEPEAVPEGGGDESPPEPDPEALAQSQAELDEALATALARRDW